MKSWHVRGGDERDPQDIGERRETGDKVDVVWVGIVEWNRMEWNKIE